MQTGRITIEELNDNLQNKIKKIDSINTDFKEFNDELVDLSNQLSQLNTKVDKNQTIVATTSQNGLMTSEDKKKLNSLTTTPSASSVKVNNTNSFFTSTDLQVVLKELKTDTLIVKDIVFSGVSVKDEKTGLYKTTINPSSLYNINSNTVVNIHIHPEYLESYSFILPVTESYDDGSFAIFSTDALTSSHNFKYDMILLKGVNYTWRSGQ